MVAFQPTRKVAPTILLVATLISLAVSSPALASLSVYDVRASRIRELASQSPQVQILSETGVGTAVIQEPPAPAPVLRRLLHVTLSPWRTTDLPGLSGFIAFKRETVQGPAPDQTGAGSTQGTIVWGEVTGWTISEELFCESQPTSICDFATVQDLDTVVPPTPWTFDDADLGTWTFHATGFRATPLLYATRPQGAGNRQIVYRGTNRSSAIPALPLVTLGALALAVLASGAAALRGRRR